MYDIVIIGSGPAGLSVALNAQIRKKSFLWFGSKSLSTKVEKAEKILNYPGFSCISGKDLIEKMREQVQARDLFIEEKRVDSIYAMGDRFISCVNQEMYESKTVILATGVEIGGAISGEAELLGKGVSYCATCDGGLYQGRKIAVVCTDPEFEEEIAYLAGIADTLSLFLPPSVSVEGKWENVRQFRGLPSAVCGTEKVDSVLFHGEEIPVEGVFFLRNTIVPSALLNGLATREGNIVVNRRQETNLPGCYAAGDCTGRPYQYAKAVGEGNVALHSALEYLHKQ